ncbi:MAG: Xyloglucanase [Owenweeksia sp. TMED14]|nr:MAG: Xyloglucanase [Owenweeksia sp. TMED14]
MNKLSITLPFLFLFLALPISSFGQNESSNIWIDGMQDYTINFNKVVSSFEDEYRGKPYQKGHGWKQFKRWQNFMEPRVDIDGTRPSPAVWYNAVSQQSTVTQDFGDWKPLGPYNAPGSSNSNGIGRINDVTFHPTNHDTIFAGAPSGGLWVSYNDGSTWQTFTDDLTNIGVSDLAIDPNNPDTMYLATGDRDAGDTYSFGLMKSTDGGVTWGTTGLSYSLTQFKRITRVLVHPKNSSIIIAATRDGMFQSTDYGVTFSLKQSGPFNSLSMISSGSDTLFAGTTGSSATVYRSTNGGSSWTLVNSGLPTSGINRVEVAVSPSSPNKIYAVYGASNSGYYGLYSSSNYGTTWTQKSTSPNILGWEVNGSGSGGQSWYDLTLAVDPLNSNTIYVGGVNIWKSTNGGTSWAINGHWYGAQGKPYVHADHHHAGFRPNSSELYVGTDGGVYKSINGGSSWTALNNGMNITQYYKISQSQTDTTLIIGGSQDNGTHLKTSPTNWNRVFGGDGMDNGVDPNTNNTLYASIYYGEFFKSTNGGSNFSSINSNLSPSGTGNWVTPFKCDPTTSNTIYAGFKNIWKSTNAGITWSGPSTNIYANSNVDEFEIAPSNSNYIYALIDRRIFLSTNGGSSWNDKSNNGNLSPQYNILGVDIDETDPNHIVISCSGYNNSNKVFESTNAGTSWTNISSGLPSVPAQCIQFEDGASNGIYVGTDIGVFFRDASTSGWVSFNENLPNVIINDIELMSTNNILRIGTYGRGVWQSPTYNSTPNPPAVQFTIEPSNTCNLTDTVQLIDQSSGSPTSWNWDITPSNATYINGTTDSSQSPYLIFNSGGTYSVKLSITNQYGSSDSTYVNALEIGGQSLPFNEDFESGYAKWSINNPDNSVTWEQVSVAGNTPGDKAVRINHFSYNSVGQKDELISPVLNFVGDTLVELDFEYAYRGYNASYKDSLKIYASSDCGQSWSLVAEFGDGGAQNWRTGIYTSSNWSPVSSSDWCTNSSFASCPTISLDNYSGASGMKIKFVSVNGYGNNFFLDNISVTGVNNCASYVTQVVDTCSSAYTWIDGITYTSSTSSPQYALTKANGCDSVLTLNLIINQPSTVTETVNACGSYTWIDGVTYSSSTSTPTVSLTNIHGCDSVITLNLSISNQTTTGTDNITACLIHQWIDGITYTTSTSSPTHTLTGSNGCDSVVTLNLTIQSVNTSVVQTGTTLTAQASSATFFWMDCSTMTIIPGQMNSAYTPTANGSYAVIVTQNSCSDTSSCFTISGIGFDEKNIDFFLKVIPNPNRGEFTMTRSICNNDAMLSIYSIDGKIVFEGLWAAGQTQKNLDLNVSPGIYNASITEKDKTIFARIEIK